ncbi:MAG: DegT/DnrJ/EryC1/StrS family aminotransferase [Bacteroidales bacterium]|nr:DegT/DnrJ/EryC1/StrS family aminotransferase [Bacteroidales bacterium]
MKYKIPLFDLNFDQKEENAVLEVLRSKWISTGPRTKKFESEFAEMLGVSNAVALTNCTVALHLAMKLCGIGEGDEVLCPSLTFVATVNAIRYVNAKPVFCDIVSKEDLNIDPDDIERKVTSHTRAIVVMHYGGFPCEMEKIMSIARSKKLFVIEDACHGPLSEYDGKKLGTIGDAGCFSFFSNKNISTGEGGMLVTNNAEFAERAVLLRSHGMTTMSYERARGHTTSYDVVDLGFNYRIDDIRAAIGIVQLEKLRDDLSRRAVIREEYIKQLVSEERILIPFLNNREFVSNYIFPVVLRNSTADIRDKIRECLANEGIQTSVHYPAVHRFLIYRGYYCKLPVCEYVSDNLITLPMYGKLIPEQIFYISDVLKKALEECLN